MRQTEEATTSPSKGVNVQTTNPKHIPDLLLVRRDSTTGELIHLDLTIISWGNRPIGRQQQLVHITWGTLTGDPTN